MTPAILNLARALGYKRIFHLDFETFSEVDINVGVRAYSTHPSTEILLAAYAYDNDETELYDAAENLHKMRSLSLKTMEHKNAIEEACHDPDVLLVAWNAPFEREILANVWGIETPVEKWLDPMIVAYSMSLPGNLGEASRILRLPEDKAKQSVGKKLINKFSKLQPKNQKIARRDWTTDPDDWAAFGEYCRMDVEAERACLNRMSRFLPPLHEFHLWHTDQRINSRGLPIDLDLVHAAQAVTDELKTALKRECSVLTGLPNPNSRAQFLPFIQGEGFEGESLAADKVDIARREGGISPLGLQALDLRGQFGKNSTAKYSKIEAQVVDGVLPYTTQFNGAGRTCRWAGRGAQFQNLPRPPKELESPEAMAVAIRAIKTRDAALLRDFYMKPVDVLAGAIRPTVRARPGKTLRVADYNAIENRVLGWLARCDAILDVFRNGLDPYKDFGTRLYNKDYNDITKKERTNSKPAVLGAGYMLGGGRLMKIKKKDPDTDELVVVGETKTGLWAYSESLGVNLTQKESQRAVDIFRDAYPEVVDFWDVVQKAAWKTIETLGAEPIRVPVGFSGECLEFGYVKPAMYIRLPSGRCIWYIRPKIKMVNMPWDDDDGKPVRRLGITYEGLNQTTRQWQRISTHAGKITENITQAAARDILAHGLRNAEGAGFSSILHVHDEVVTEENIDDVEHSVERLEAVLCELPDWAHDLPMKAEGYENPFYMKD